MVNYEELEQRIMMYLEPGNVYVNEMTHTMYKLIFLDRNKPANYLCLNLSTNKIESLNMNNFIGPTREVKFRFVRKDPIDINSPIFKALYEV